MSTAKRRSLIVGVMAVVLALGSSWAAASVMTMADLLGGATIQSGDLQFSDFRNYSSPGPLGWTAVDPSQIAVSPTVDSGEYGLQFQSPAFFAASGQLQETYFEFTVTCLNSANRLMDNSMRMNAGVFGTGRVSISEDVTDAADQSLLAQGLVSIIDSGGSLYAHHEFPHLVSSIFVTKDISMMGYADGQASMSYFTQTFSQTVAPEPATLALLAAGGLWVFRRKR